MGCIPSTDRLVEGTGIPEHKGHVKDCCGIPRSNGLVEVRSFVKHALHVLTPAVSQPPIG